MLTWLDLYGPENVVDASELHRLSVDSCFPSWIIDLREYQHTTLVAVGFVNKVVGLIALDGGYGVARLLDSLTELLLKLLVGHGRMLESSLASASISSLALST